MKYGELINDALEIKEFENGMEVGGSLTEQEIIGMGYKPVCETERIYEESTVRYTEYKACIVQEWAVENNEGYEE